MAAPIVGFCRQIVSRISTGNAHLHLNLTPISCSNLYNKVHCRYQSVLPHKAGVISRCFTPRSTSCQIRCYSFRGYRGQLTFDTPKKSRDFIATLMPKERKILLTELQNFQDRIEMEGLYIFVRN